MGILGPSKKEAWQNFSQNMNAEFIDDGMFKGGSKVKLDYKNWEILLDNYTVSTGKSSTTYTRARAIYVLGREFDFKIFKRSIFTKVAKAMGRQYAYTGDNAFDEAFAIRSSDEPLVQKLFDNQQIKQMFYGLKATLFLTKKTRGKKETKHVENEREIHYYTVGIIKDEEQLTLLFGIIVSLLDSFVQLGIAKSDKPQISYTNKPLEKAK